MLVLHTKAPPVAPQFNIWFVAGVHHKNKPLNEQIKGNVSDRKANVLIVGNTDA